MSSLVVELELRVCTACGSALPLDAFHRDKRSPDGLRRQCKACRSARVRDWYAANQERQRDRQRERREKWADRIRRQDAERYERNRDERIERATAGVHLRRTRLFAAGHDSSVTRANLRKQYGDACFYCGCEMTFARTPRGTKRPPNLATLEHVVPVSRGGSHTWDNVVLACLRCNFSKGARDGC